jgi:hypothetical protein
MRLHPPIIPPNYPQSEIHPTKWYVLGDIGEKSKHAIQLAKITALRIDNFRVR